MSEILFDARAYCKIMLHAAKYPHLAVNGLLLAEAGKPSVIVDAVPLFHQCLQVSPMAEVALVQVEAKASRKGRQIVGYYVGCENFYENRLERAPGLRIADKIAENCPDACVALIDNRSISINMRYPALLTWQHRDNRWTKAKCLVDNDRVTFDAVSRLLQRGAAKELHDYDNYLDNTQNDWDNVHLNGDLKQILAMY
ncbi:ER membrane protein complex subunit 8/9 homolog [Anopheles ziemanni]|uniref:ER membrane protein complex subunit 8/9 homolog n=1 Tax=Anopheles coustani TaxID=139045 RepID=UPI002657D56B|nr:ER membrane protein complex subunit 8/9 homolog [Anopheles coustani]XP_058171965.1 ER membrane protein complex subunit 8/9 homolog [Anopheles ziemanni]